MSIQITKNKFLEFEEVRQSGRFNMFDPSARKMTNLSKDEWSVIMTDYKKLSKAWLKEK
jgi:hypothetical protein